MRSGIIRSVLAGVLVMTATAAVQAAVVGPAVNASYTDADSAGQRINVD